MPSHSRSRREPGRMLGRCDEHPGSGDETASGSDLAIRAGVGRVDSEDGRRRPSRRRFGRGRQVRLLLTSREGYFDRLDRGFKATSSLIRTYSMAGSTTRARPVSDISAGGSYSP